MDDLQIEEVPKLRSIYPRVSIQFLAYPYEKTPFAFSIGYDKIGYKFAIHRIMRCNKYMMERMIIYGKKYKMCVEDAQKLILQ